MALIKHVCSDRLLVSIKIQATALFYYSKINEKLGDKKKDQNLKELKRTKQALHKPTKNFRQLEKSVNIHNIMLFVSQKNQKKDSVGLE